MVQDNDKGGVEQCLKNKFKDRLIKDGNCKQVRRHLTEYHSVHDEPLINFCVLYSL
jgi:hypothetical protein